MVAFFKSVIEQAVGFTMMEFFFVAIGVFTSIILALIVTMLFMMFAKSKVAARQKQLQAQFKQWLVRIILEDAQPQDKPFEIPADIAPLLHYSFPRRALLTELVLLRHNLSGQSAENLCKLYRQLRLDRLSANNLHSNKWNLKAKGLQELAIMEQQEYLPTIATFTNHPHQMVRMEAQLAMVQLQQYNGLTFFSNLVYPLTEWHQVKLLQLLAHLPIPDAAMVRSWLKSENSSVIQFALKLIAEQHANQFQEDVIACLNHPEELVRQQAIVCLSELPSGTAALALRAHFATEQDQELQLSILSGLIKTGSAADVDFLKELQAATDERVRFAAGHTLKHLQPTA